MTYLTIKPRIKKREPASYDWEFHHAPLRQDFTPSLKTIAISGYETVTAGSMT